MFLLILFVNVHCRPNRVVADGILFAFGFLWKTNKIDSNCHRSFKNQMFHLKQKNLELQSRPCFYFSRFISKCPSYCHRTGRTHPMKHGENRWRQAGEGFALVTRHGLWTPDGNCTAVSLKGLPPTHLKVNVFSFGRMVNGGSEQLLTGGFWFRLAL